MGHGKRRLRVGGCCFQGLRLLVSRRCREEKAVLRHVTAEVRQTLGRIPAVCDDIVKVLEDILADVSWHNKKTNSTRVGFAGVGITGGSCILAAPLTGGVSVLAGGILCSAVASFGSVGTLASDHYRSKYDFAPRLRDCDQQLQDLATELDVRLGSLVDQLQAPRPGMDMDTAHEVLRDLVGVIESGVDAAQGLASVAMGCAGTARTVAMSSTAANDANAKGATAAEATSAKTSAVGGAAAARAHGAHRALHGVKGAHSALQHLHAGSAVGSAAAGAAAQGLAATSPTARAAAQLHAAGSAAANAAGAVPAAAAAGSAAGTTSAAGAAATSAAAAGGGAAGASSAAAAATKAVGTFGGFFGILAGVVDGGIAVYALKNGHPSEKAAEESLERVRLVREKCSAVTESIAILP